MGLHGKTCGVRIYGPRSLHDCCEHGCEKCQIGCFEPAAYRNPFFGTDFCNEEYWWRGWYSDAEFLCVECYEDMVSEAKVWEDMHAEAPGYKEDPEYTKILETL
jgi:hypothetical protein